MSQQIDNSTLDYIFNKIDAENKTVSEGTKKQWLHILQFCESKITNAETINKIKSYAELVSKPKSKPKPEPESNLKPESELTIDTNINLTPKQNIHLDIEPEAKPKPTFNPDTIVDVDLTPKQNIHLDIESNSKLTSNLETTTETTTETTIEPESGSESEFEHVTCEQTDDDPILSQLQVKDVESEYNNCFVSKYRHMQESRQITFTCKKNKSGVIFINKNDIYEKYTRHIPDEENNEVLDLIDCINLICTEVSITSFYVPYALEVVDEKKSSILFLLTFKKQSKVENRRYNKRGFNSCGVIYKNTTFKLKYNPFGNNANNYIANVNRR